MHNHYGQIKDLNSYDDGCYVDSFLNRASRMSLFSKQKESNSTFAVLNTVTKRSKSN